MQNAESSPRNHERKGKFVKAGENLYRYSTTKIYYAVFRKNGKLAWKSLDTQDRDIAKRKLKEEMEKAGRIDARQEKMTLESLLKIFEDQLRPWPAGR